MEPNEPTQEEFIQNKLNELDNAIQSLPDRVASEGNITMKQHLINLKQEILANPSLYYSTEMEKIRLAEEIDEEEFGRGE